MRKKSFIFISLLAIISIISTSFNPVISVSPIKNENQDDIKYITIPSEEYPLLKEFLINMNVNEAEIEKLDLLSFEVEEENTVYIPIVCEIVQIISYIFICIGVVSFFFLMIEFYYGPDNAPHPIFARLCAFIFLITEKILDIIFAPIIEAVCW